MEPFHWWAVIFGFSCAEYKWKDELWWDAFETNFTFSVRWDQQMTTEPRKKVCLFVSVPGDSGVNKPLIGCKQGRIHLPPGKMSLCSDIISHRGGWAGCQWSKHICPQHKRLHKRLCVRLGGIVLITSRRALWLQKGHLRWVLVWHTTFKSMLPQNKLESALCSTTAFSGATVSTLWLSNNQSLWTTPTSERRSRPTSYDALILRCEIKILIKLIFPRLLSLVTATCQIAVNWNKWGDSASRGTAA